MMQDRTYFLLGDIVSNASVGALAGLAAHWLVNPGWWMLPAMVVAMVLGMVIASVAAVPFMRWFGAMEVMLPTMLGGMLAGMVVGMAGAMHPVSTATAIKTGALVGLLAWGACSYVDYLLRGNATMYKDGGHGD